MEEMLKRPCLSACLPWNPPRRALMWLLAKYNQVKRAPAPMITSAWCSLVQNICIKLFFFSEKDFVAAVSDKCVIVMLSNRFFVCFPAVFRLSV